MKKAKGLKCPTCGGRLDYEDSYLNLKCVTKGCVFGMTVDMSGAREHGNFNFFIRFHAKPRVYGKIADLFKDIVEAKNENRPLAKNYPSAKQHTPRKPGIAKEDLPDTLRRYGVAEDDFDYIRSGEMSVRELSSTYNMPMEQITEIRDLEVVG